MKGGKKKSSGIQAATDTPKPAGAGEAAEHEKRDEYAGSDGEEEQVAGEGEEDEDEEEKTYEESGELQIEEVDVAEAETERPKLAEGFYEIEAVRRKRVRKGQVQYLIKWRGWPETENTWEPVKNLMSCSDVIDAFEESSQSGKQRSTRKRKRKVGATQTQPKKKQQQQQQSSPAAATYNVPAVKVRIIEEPTPSPLPSGLKSTNRVNNIGGVLNSKVDKVVNETDLRLCLSLEETGEQNELNLKLSELKGATSTNENPMDRSGNGLSNGFAKVNGAESNQSDRCTGAKKRKSGSVRRFKQDTTSAVVDDVQDALAGGALATFVQEGSHNHEFVGSDLVCRNKPDDSKDAYTITQLIKPISYSASLSNDVQDVSVTFRAKRSDGKEMMVDNKFLKMNNPLLLINFYEQHLRYNPAL
ncbi:chromo domain protein LHP1 [Lycium ferocissimum]|uniref:chromo domain protein LHP1 n=1 Tax=Lycium ferocissimum TaxID=112874 RepID=UPI00281629F9|nr:chromo domain protein LHP1 [Lycium ferocissimum]